MKKEIKTNCLMCKKALAYRITTDINRNTCAICADCVVNYSSEEINEAVNRRTEIVLGYIDRSSQPNTNNRR